MKKITAIVMSALLLVSLAGFAIADNKEFNVNRDADKRIKQEVRIETDRNNDNVGLLGLGLNSDAGLDKKIRFEREARINTDNELGLSSLGVGRDVETKVRIEKEVKVDRNVDGDLALGLGLNGLNAFSALNSADLADQKLLGMNMGMNQMLV